MRGAKKGEVTLEALANRLDDLRAREDIRTCLFRVNRGMDRIDRDMLASGFFADAKVRWASPEPVDFKVWIEQALAMQQRTQRVQHLIGNILIDLRDDEADVESYEIGRHLTQIGDEQKDLIIAARYIDRFERRDDIWRISHREKAIDWMRILVGTDSAYNNAGHKGLRNGDDPSYVMFGAGAFHNLI